MATTKKTTTKKATPVKKIVEKEKVVEKQVAKKAIAHVEIKGEKIMRDIGAEVSDVIDAVAVKKAEPVNTTTFDNFVIREIMHQKGVTWERAVEILSNPS